MHVRLPLRVRAMRELESVPWFFWITITSRQYLVMWIVVQSVLLLDQWQGRTTISAAGHLGGAAVGAFAWWRLGRGASAPLAPTRAAF